MFGRRHFRIFWLCALAVLCVAQAAHAYEHWEIAAHRDCVAHAHAEGDHGDGGSRHDHGCTSHDHAPALTGGIFTLTVSESMTTLSSNCPSLPAPLAVSIDHPPRLS